MCVSPQRYVHLHLVLKCSGLWYSQVFTLYSNCSKCTCCMFSAWLLARCFALQAEIYLCCTFSLSLFLILPLCSPPPPHHQPPFRLYLQLALSLAGFSLPDVPPLCQRDKMSRTEVKRRSDGIIKSKRTHYRRGEIGVFASTSRPFHSEFNVLFSITTNQRRLLMSHFARQVDLICFRVW